MGHDTFYARLPVPVADDETYQTFGDFKFFPNGGSTLGGVFFARGIPIHLFYFGANLVASRHYNEPNLLEIETPFGTRLRFLYRPLFRKWYQLVEVDDPKLYFHQERYGTIAAVVLYNLRWATRFTAVVFIRVALVLAAIAAYIILLRFFD